MGGNALKQKGLETVRLGRVNFKKMSPFIVYELSQLFDNVSIVPYYRNKESFGDMDVMVSGYKLAPISIEMTLKEVFNPTVMVCNGGCYSFDMNKFQIDVIVTKKKYYKTSLLYYSYNDLGNFMGRIAHKMGFKYGYRGLSYLYRSDLGYIIDEVDICDDSEKIFEFLGFDYSRFEQGFDELQDIFDYVINSKYYSSDIFQYGNLNHTNRVRNRKRKSYESFLSYINTSDNPDVTRTYDFKTKPEYYEIASSFFGSDLVEKISDIDEREQELKLIKSKFNGSIIMELIPSLSGKRLGQFIQYVRQSTYNFDYFVMNKSQEKINKLIVDKFQEFSK